MEHGQKNSVKGTPEALRAKTYSSAINFSTTNPTRIGLSYKRASVLRGWQITSSCMFLPLYSFTITFSYDN